MVFQIIIYLMVIMLFALMGFSLYRKNRYSKRMLEVFSVAAVTVLFFSLNLQCPMVKLAVAFDGLYFAAIDWLLFTFLLLIYDLTDVTFKNLEIGYFIRRFIVVCSIMDALSMVLNCFTGHVFALTPVFFDNGSFYYWNIQFFPAYYIHLYFDYIICAITAFELIYRAVKSSSFYRGRFITLLVGFTLLLVSNGMYLILGWDLDYSIIMYAFLGLFVFIYIHFALPRELFHSMVNNVSMNISSAVLCYDMNGKCIYANKMGQKLFCVRNRTFFRAEEFFSETLVRFKDKDFWIFEENLYVNSEERKFKVEFNKIRDSKNRIASYYIKLDDITDEILRFQNERYNATHDKLTGLLNRNAFFEAAQELLKNEPDCERYLITTNIKNFKLINDIFGARLGDEIIVQQAKMLSVVKHEGVLQGRINGDRFAMLMPKSIFNPEKAIQNTEAVKKLVLNVNYRIRMFIGVYEIADPFESVQIMFDKANLAIQSISDQWEQVIAFYNTDLMEKLVHQKNVISEFNKALEEEQFCMYLQPQINTKGDCTGAEALVRWNHPEKGLLFPGAFVEILENCGFISKLDRFIWEKAVQKLAEWKKRGIDKYISVNISAKDFYYDDLYGVFTGLVEKYNVSPDRLNLEITETVLLYDLAFHKSVLNKLKNYGFKIEMDDFGSGYSSLNTLKNLQMDVLKIDMGFLRKTEHEDRSRKILESIVVMAKQLGMQVVCEGVETASQAEFLGGVGTDLFQGYYFSKPIPVSDFEVKYLEEEK